MVPHSMACLPLWSSWSSTVSPPPCGACGLPPYGPCGASLWSPSLCSPGFPAVTVWSLCSPTVCPVPPPNDPHGLFLWSFPFGPCAPTVSMALTYGPYGPSLLSFWFPFMWPRRGPFSMVHVSFPLVVSMVALLYGRPAILPPLGAPIFAPTALMVLSRAMI